MDSTDTNSAGMNDGQVSGRIGWDYADTNLEPTPEVDADVPEGRTIAEMAATYDAVVAMLPPDMIDIDLGGIDGVENPKKTEASAATLRKEEE